MQGFRFVLCWGSGTTTHETGQHPVANVALRQWGYLGRTQEASKIIREVVRGGAGGKQAAGLPSRALCCGADPVGGCQHSRRLLRTLPVLVSQPSPGWPRARASAPPSPLGTVEASPGINAASCGRCGDVAEESWVRARQRLLGVTVARAGALLPLHA